MKVDIWSDVRCPFCYIGKRKFESALAQFEHKDKVEVEWHSFELDPNAETVPDANPSQHLADKYGRPLEWAEEMQANVTDTAAEVGLKFNLEKSIVANSFDARKLSPHFNIRQFRQFFQFNIFVDDRRCQFPQIFSFLPARFAKP